MSARKEGAFLHHPSSPRNPAFTRQPGTELNGAEEVRAGTLVFAQKEGSIMSLLGVILLVLVLLLVFGGGGYYWTRRRV